MITLKNVTKEFHLDSNTTISPVRNVSLEIKKGEFIMIVGRSGSGKSTLLNLCSGLIKPTSGQVLIDDIDIQSLDEKALSNLRSNKIGFVFQSASTLPSLSVMENVAVPTMFSGEVSTNDARFKRASEVLELVGLGDRLDVLPRQLSGGELRRVAIARALMNKPEILLADEPTSDLDEQTEIKIVSVLQKIHDTGVTILMVTHSLELVPYATRALKMESGTLIPFESKSGQRVPETPDLVPETHKTKNPQPALAAWRTPIIVGFVALTIALLAMTFAFGLSLGKGTQPTQAAQTGNDKPGPVLPASATAAPNASATPAASVDAMGNPVVPAVAAPGASAAVNPAGFTRIVKRTNQTINNSTTLVNCTDLYIPCKVGKSYLVSGHIVYESSSTADLKINLMSGTAAFGYPVMYGGLDADSGVAASTGLFNTNLVAGGQGAGTERYFTFNGIFKASSSTNVYIQVAQNTAEATNTIIKANSFLSFQQLD